MKGSRVDQFHIGQYVAFHTDIGHKVYRKEQDDEGKPVQVFVRNNRIDKEDYGRIVKLHKSGKQGIAEIRPISGTSKVSRRLQHVTKA